MLLVFVAAAASGCLVPCLSASAGVCVARLAGSSYPEFIQSMHLPAQLAEVDPIVASFCGGAVGVVSALLVVEVSEGVGLRGAE